MPYKNREDKQEYQRNWLKKRRRDFLKGKSCKICGSTRNLELHHRDKKKKESHKIWSWSPERFKEESKKCDIICRKCHEEMHADEKRKD